MTRLFAALFAALSLAACGGGSPNGSCTYTNTAGGTTAMGCTELDGPGITPEALRNQCNNMVMASGNTYTYSSGGCPSANVTGRCTTMNNVGSSTFTQVVVYYAPVPTESIRETCARQMGTFSEN